MGRSPCCSKEGLNRGAWTALEDKILTAYIKAHGEGKWRNLPKRAGLKRCGKSCRLRWLNYLRPDIKRGNISNDEEELIIRLHKLLGNRWSLIAGRLPGRTDNEIKNYWNTTLRKKAKAQSCSSLPKQNRSKNPQVDVPRTTEASTVIRTKATKCTNVLLPLETPPTGIHTASSTPEYPVQVQDYQTYLVDNPEAFENVSGVIPNIGTEQVHQIYRHESDALNLGCCDDLLQRSNEEAQGDCQGSKTLCMDALPSLPYEPLFEDWTTDACFEENATVDVDSLSFLLDSGDWPCP